MDYDQCSGLCFLIAAGCIYGWWQLWLRDKESRMNGFNNDDDDKPDDYL